MTATRPMRTMKSTMEAERRMPGNFMDQKGTLGSVVCVIKLTVRSSTFLSCASSQRLKSFKLGQDGGRSCATSLKKCLTPQNSSTLFHPSGLTTELESPPTPRAHHAHKHAISTAHTARPQHARRGRLCPRIPRLFRLRLSASTATRTRVPTWTRPLARWPLANVPKLGVISRSATAPRHSPPIVCEPLIGSFGFLPWIAPPIPRRRPVAPARARPDSPLSRCDRAGDSSSESPAVTGFTPWVCVRLIGSRARSRPWSGFLSVLLSTPFQ
eukprot:maker-scaffold1022_size69981-snap-gene-0.10 protein:Tk07083 transcript:maker-scaffold1022_size69981-snap-gene-0.10-mRNA-1 annotation:"OO_Ba0005L10-OO_Ba0081K17.8"